MPAINPVDLQYKAVAFEMKADGDGPGGISGLGAVWNNIDSTGDIIAPEAFKDNIKLFIDSGFVGGINHDWNNPIGHPVEAREVPEGLYFRAVLDDTDDARRLRAKMLPNPASGRATIRKLSIGYKTLQSETLAVPEGVLDYWTKAAYTPTRDDIRALAGLDSVRLLTKLHLYEISPVVVPANDRATITGVKSGTESRPDFVSHSRAVVSANQEFISRATSRVDARLKVGRMPSQANLDEIASVADAMATGAERLHVLIARALPAREQAAAHDVKADDPVPSEPSTATLDVVAPVLEAIAPEVKAPPSRHADVARLYAQFRVDRLRIQYETDTTRAAFAAPVGR